MEHKSISVLIVDSQGGKAGTVLNTLAKRGYDCSTVRTASDALAAMEHHHSKAVLMGGDLPDMATQDLLHEIHAVYPDTAIVALLDDTDMETGMGLVRQGADDVFFLPRDIGRVGDALPVILERRRYFQDSMIKLGGGGPGDDGQSDGGESSGGVMAQSFIDVVKTFVGLLETRDRYLGSHSKRVATFCRALSERYDLGDRVRREIEIGALLHDIGKMGFPDAILTKTRDYFMVAQLTQKEREIFKTHTVIGQEVIELVDATQHIGAYIRHHHERFDGKGYPDGKQGYLIPLGARIIGIVDAYDRIVTSGDRQNQTATRALFLKFMHKNRGTIFDPEAAEHLVDYIRELGSREYAVEKRINITDLAPGMVLARDLFTTSGVLVVSQYEKIIAKDIVRLERFNEAKMIMSGVYVYESAAHVPAQAEKAAPAPAAVEKRKSLDFDAVTARIDTTRELKTLPGIYQSVIGCIEDPKSTRDDVAAVINKDPVMVLKILKIANSPLFGFNREITDIEDAIPLLGFNEIRNIVTSVTIMGLMRESKGSALAGSEFWKHSIGVAVIARILAKRVQASDPELYFTAGILHDIGKIVLDQLFPEDYARVISLVNNESIFFRKAERTVFGRPHTDIGDYVLDRWSIPAVLRDAVKNHHSPMDAVIDPKLVSAVHIADSLAHMLHIGDSGERVVPRVESFAEHQLSISVADFDDLVPVIDEQLMEGTALLSL